jgi:formate dehydrogenase subunit gamma
MLKPLKRALWAVSLACVVTGLQAQSATPAAPVNPATPSAAAPSVPTTSTPGSAPSASPEAKPAASADSKAPGGVQAGNIFAVPNDSQAERTKSQPGNNAPMWREAATGGTMVTTLPAREGGVLIQKSGEQWRQFRNGEVTRKGGWALVGVLGLITLFYLYRGQIKVSQPATGRLIERFTFVERCVHWANAICFCLLAVTGLLMLFGKYVVLPVLGHTVFSWFALLSKNMHNFVGPLFSITLVIIFLTFVKDNFPKAGDLKWLMKAGGLFSKDGSHIPTGRFNAGEKMVFWGGVVVLGVIVVTTGFILDFPNYGQTRADMQEAWSWHAVAALVFVAMIAGHIYIGTLGTEGAYGAMKTGYVDESWAKEHHEHWYNDVKSGKIPAHRSAGDASVLAGQAAALNPSANRTAV